MRYHTFDDRQIVPKSVEFSDTVLMELPAGLFGGRSWDGHDTTRCGSSRVQLSVYIKGTRKWCSPPSLPIPISGRPVLISLASPTLSPSWKENTGPWRRKLREAEYGSLEHDRAFLEQISPIRSVDRMTAPLFVVHGANDPRVPVGEAEQIVAALRTRNIPVEYMRCQLPHGWKPRACV